jgi:acyl dehydratase
MSFDVTFDAYPVGVELGPVSLDVTEEMASRFARAVDSTCDWYTGHSPFGGPIAPYTAVEQVMLVTLGATYRVADAPGGTVQYGLDAAYHMPPPVGTRLTIRGRTLEKIERPGRYQTSFAYDIADEVNGTMIMSGKVAQAHLVEGAARTKSEGSRPEQSEAVPASFASFSSPGLSLASLDGATQLAPGARLAQLEIPITLECMRLYSAWPKLADYGRELENQHTSEREAFRLGRPGVIAMGAHLVGYLEEYMTRYFGRPWLTGGQLGVRFVGMVLVGDTLVVSATVRTCTHTGKGRLIEFDVACRTTRGTTAIVGTAVVALP